MEYNNSDLTQVKARSSLGNYVLAQEEASGVMKTNWCFLCNNGLYSPLGYKCHLISKEHLELEAVVAKYWKLKKIAEKYSSCEEDDI